MHFNLLSQMELQENCNVIINENYKGSTDNFFDDLHPEVLKMKLKNTSHSELKQESDHHKTTYFETLMHLFKGNVGPGMNH